MSVLSSLKPTTAGSGGSKKMATKKKSAKKKAGTKKSSPKKVKKKSSKKAVTALTTTTKKRKRKPTKAKRRRKRPIARRDNLYRGHVQLRQLRGKLGMKDVEKFLVPAAMLFGGAVLFKMLDLKLLEPHVLKNSTGTKKNFIKGGLALLIGGGLAFASKNDKLQLLGFGIAAGGLADAFAQATLNAFKLSGTTRIAGSMARTISGDNPFRIGGAGVGTSNSFATKPWHTNGGSVRKVSATNGASSVAGKSNDFPV